MCSQQIFPVPCFKSAYFRRYLLNPINRSERRICTIILKKNRRYENLPALLSWNTVVCLIIRSGVLWLKGSEQKESLINLFLKIHALHVNVACLEKLTEEKHGPHFNLGPQPKKQKQITCMSYYLIKPSDIEYLHYPIWHFFCSSSLFKHLVSSLHQTQIECKN